MTFERRQSADWLHINAASYVGPNRWYEAGDARFHPDNVLFSSREANIIAIVDRRTGAIVWRMGPDYRDTKALAALGQIIGQHHPHIIPEGLPGAGNLLVFDNGGSGGYGAPNPAARLPFRLWVLGLRARHHAHLREPGCRRAGPIGRVLSSVRRRAATPMQPAATCRWKPVVLQALLAVVVCPLGAAAQRAEARISVRFFPVGMASRSPLVTVEMSEPPAGREHGIRSLTVVNTPTGPTLTTFSTQLPSLRLGPASLAPSYGDQSWVPEFPGGSLAGFRLDERKVRGLSLTTGNRTAAVTFFVGQVNPSERGLLESVIPRVLAVTSTFAPSHGWIIAPRLVAPLAGDASGPAQPSVGVGVRRQLSSQLQLIGDLGIARAPQHGAARFAMAGVIAQWGRTGLEASASHAGSGFSLLGPVPFAAEQRQQLSGSLALSRHVKLDGRVSATRWLERHRREPRIVAGALTMQIDGGAVGRIGLSVDRSPQSDRSSRTLAAEWKPASPLHVRFLQEGRPNADRRARPPPARSVRLEVGGAAGANQRLGFKTETTLRLPGAGDGARIVPRLAGHVAVTRNLRVAGEAGLALFGPRAERAIRMLRITVDVHVYRALSLQVLYDQKPGLPLFRRFEGRLTVIRF